MGLYYCGVDFAIIKWTYTVLKLVSEGVKWTIDNKKADPSKSDQPFHINYELCIVHYEFICIHLREHP